MTPLIWAYIAWVLILIGFIFQRKAYILQRKAYEAKCKDCEFLYKMLRKHVSVEQIIADAEDEIFNT